MKKICIAAVAALTLLGSAQTTFAANYARRIESRATDEIAPPPTAEFKPLTELPAGATVTDYVKTGACLMTMDMEYSVMQQIDGFVAKVARVDDKIYIGPMISQAGYPMSYLEGTIEDGVATFQFPQPMGYYRSYGSVDEDWAVLYRLTPTGSGFMLRGCAQQELKYTVGEDGSLTLMSEYSNLYITDAIYTKGIQGNMTWQKCGIGDNLTGISPLTETTAAIPDGVEPETWNLIYGDNGRHVGVARDGDDIYISGLYSDLPEGVVKGTVVDGKAKFANGQFQGIDDFFTACVFAYVGEITVITDPEFGDYEAISPTSGEIEFTIDPQNGTLTSEKPIVFAPGGYMTGIFEAITGAVISKPDPDAPIVLRAPTITDFYPAMGQEPASLWFTISTVSEGSNILDEKKFHWCFYIDGEQFTFEPDEYYGLTASAEDFPYPYSNGRDIEFFLGKQGLTVYAEGFETLGVQAIYRDGDKETRSEIATINSEGEAPGEDAIEAVAEGAVPVSTEFYDLGGRQIANPSAGIYIVRTAYSDGRVSTSTKIIK